MPVRKPRGRATRHLSVRIPLDIWHAAKRIIDASVPKTTLNAWLAALICQAVDAAELGAHPTNLPDPARLEFEREFARVFGQCVRLVGKKADHYRAPTWEHGWRFLYSRAVPVLRSFLNDHGATDSGDADVCTALAHAKALYRD